MALFRRGETKAQISTAPAQPAEVKAAAAGSYSGERQAISQPYNFYSGFVRNQMMKVPAIARARDLHVSVITSMGLKMYRERWDEREREMVEEYLAPRAWLRRPDPRLSYQAFMAGVVDDCLFYGRAMLFITSRTADGYPASFQRLPMASIETPENLPPVFYQPATEIEFAGNPIDPANVLQIISASEGWIYNGWQSVSTALKIEESRYRNAASAVPSGILRQTSGEALSASELADLSEAFNNARLNNQTAALNQYLEYIPTTSTPDKMLLIDSANYSALDLSRLCSCPPYLLGVSTGSYSYQSSEQSRMDMWMFGSKTVAESIAGAFSSDQILPKGTFVEFDTEDYLGDIAMMEPSDTGINEGIQENTQEELA